VGSLSPKIYSDYERLRKTRRGVAVAEAVDGRCSACHLAMRLQFFQELRRNDSVMCCESCGRILFYNPPPQEFDELGPKSEAEAQSAESGA
jgi:predicted  nucleic acid-binding Zn-ribbon protein